MPCWGLARRESNPVPGGFKKWDIIEIKDNDIVGTATLDFHYMFRINDWDKDKAVYLMQEHNETHLNPLAKPVYDYVTVEQQQLNPSWLIVTNVYNQDLKDKEKAAATFDDIELQKDPEYVPPDRVKVQTGTVPDVVEVIVNHNARKYALDPKGFTANQLQDFEDKKVVAFDSSDIATKVVEKVV